MNLSETTQTSPDVLVTKWLQSSCIQTCSIVSYLTCSLRSQTIGFNIHFCLLHAPNILLPGGPNYLLPGDANTFAWCMVQLRFACCIKHTFAWSKYFFAGSKYTFVWWSKHTFALCIVQLCFPWCSKHTFAWSKSFFAWSKYTFVPLSGGSNAPGAYFLKGYNLQCATVLDLRRGALLCNLDLQKTPVSPDL